MLPSQMKPKLSNYLNVVISLWALVSCSHTLAQRSVSKSYPANTALPDRVFQAVNDCRRANGAKDLQRHPGMDRLAWQHCEYLRQHRGTFSLNGKNVSHIGYEGRALVSKKRYNMFSYSENVAVLDHSGGNPASGLVNAWLSSKAHKQSMLDKWTHTGIGIVVDSDGMVFGVELFGTMSYSQMMRRERFSQF